MDYENLIPPFHLVDECGLFRLLALNRAFVSQAWRFFFFLNMNLNMTSTLLPFQKFMISK